ncbi:hypothetical protein [Aureitalea marina]|nr:hypothetical protein [Aureitalea marina]
MIDNLMMKCCGLGDHGTIVSRLVFVFLEGILWDRLPDEFVLLVVQGSI